MARLAFILIIIFILLSWLSRAQENLYSYMKGEYSRISVDQLENVYLLTRNSGEIKKYNGAGDSIAVFSDIRRFGSISSIDVSNPLKTLVYFKNFNTVIFLDRLMNNTGVIDLRKSGIYQTSAVGLSYDNMVWAYDIRDAQLKKINASGKIVFESADLKTVFDEVPQPEYIFDQNGLVYLYDKKIGLIIFDHYGTWKKTLFYQDLHHVGMVNNQFYGSRNDSLFLIKPEKWSVKQILLPFKPASVHQFILMPQNYFLLLDKGVYRHSFSEE